MNDDLRNLVPEDRTIKVGRTKENFKEYKMYPLCIKDFRKLENVMQKFFKIIFSAVGQTSIKNTKNIMNDFLPELLDMMAVSSFSPDEEVKQNEIRERSEYFENNMTVPQIGYAVKCVMELNKFEDMLKNLTALLQQNSQKVVGQNQTITGAPRLNR